MTERPESEASPTKGTLGEYLPWGLAALSLGAAAIHFSMTTAHFDTYWAYGAFFAAAAWFQLGWGVAVLKRPTKGVLITGIVASVIIVATWVLSRTVGVLVGPSASETESISMADLLATGAETLIIIGAAALLSPAVAAKRIRSDAVLPVVGAVGAVVIILSTLSVTPAYMDDHSHGAGDEVADGHAAGAADGHDDHGAGETAADHGMSEEEHAAMDSISLDDRCDLEFNTAGYYRDAEVAGLDPLGSGGADHGAHDDHAAEGEASDGEASDAGQAHDEGMAAANVVRLSQLTEAEYDEWLQTLDPTRDADAPDDTKAGGHSGPQTWAPGTDEAECEALAADLEVARETALSYPTPVEARAGGYTMVTGYVPGIASHWMNFSYVDGEFDITKPEMLLYDGTGDNAHMIGLSYYIVKEGDQEPADGFTGDWDHYHRHVGLCVRGTVVIGSSTTTEEECAAMGGRKQGGSGGWMSHAWVVPGCESPWGVFSGENPRLDMGVAQNTGSADGACAGNLRDYDDTPGPADDQVESASRSRSGSGSDEEASGD